MADRQKLAESVAAELFATEMCLDAAIAQAGKLITMLPLARQEAGVSARVGQAAIAQVAAGIALLSDARSQMVAAHQSLADCAGEARISPRNFGGFIDKPARGHRGLTVIGQAKAG